MFSEMFFSSQINFKTIFYIAGGFLCKKNLNTAYAPPELKQDLLYWIFSCQDFVYFC